ncbi:MAG: hypothetical protein LBU16_10110 [Treponema sp.]|jgi:hypothetical protein|nr:hypothetical protein [Treponema sp.]
MVKKIVKNPKKKAIINALAITLFMAPLGAQEYGGETPPDASQEALPGVSQEAAQEAAQDMELETAPEELVFNQGVIPEALRQPQRGDETTRYPRDAVIGELGRGLANEGAYRYARNLLQGALSLNRESALLAGAAPSQLEELFARLETLSPQQYRLGGGREEADGSTSFLFRFISRDMSMAGELYIRFADNAWRLDDIIVEEARALSEGGLNAYKFDFSPYERFF